MSLIVAIGNACMTRVSRLKIGSLYTLEEDKCFHYLSTGPSVPVPTVPPGPVKESTTSFFSEWLRTLTPVLSSGQYFTLHVYIPVT